MNANDPSQASMIDVPISIAGPDKDKSVISLNKRVALLSVNTSSISAFNSQELSSGITTQPRYIEILTSTS